MFSRLIQFVTPKNSNVLFQATFEQAAVGIAHVAPSGTWLRVNDKLCKIVGYSRAELLKLTFQDITHPDDLEKDMAYVNQVLKGEIQTYTMEKRYFHKQGDVVWIRLTVSLTRRNNGMPDYFISVIEDITHLKQVESEIIRLKLDSERLIEQQLIVQMMLALAHELNQPLNAAGSYSEAALRLIGPDKLNLEKLSEVVKLNIVEIKRAGDVLRNLMKSMDNHDNADHAFELTNMLNLVVNDYQNEQFNRQLKIHLAGCESPIEVYAKPFLIEKVLRNLLLNADQDLHSDVIPSPRVIIRVISLKETVIVSVINDGSAIPIEVADKMFSPFFTTKTKGVGMGLVISRSLIESCNGKLWYQPEGDKTAFHFSLTKCN